MLDPNAGGMDTGLGEAGKGGREQGLSRVTCPGCFGFQAAETSSSKVLKGTKEVMGIRTPG